MTNTSTVQLPDTDVIDTAQLQRMMLERSGHRILDVRTGGEFDSVHIAGFVQRPARHPRRARPRPRRCRTPRRAGVQVGVTRRPGPHQAVRGRQAAAAPARRWPRRMDAPAAATSCADRARPGRWTVRSASSPVRSRWSASSLSIFVPKAKWLAGGVATGLTFSAVTNTCAMGNVLAKLPYNRGRGCDIEAVLTELRAES